MITRLLAWLRARRAAAIAEERRLYLERRDAGFAEHRARYEQKTLDR